MSSYWDLHEKERAALTEEDVRQYLDFHLMEQGVLKPKEPEYKDVPDVKIGTTTSYAIEHGKDSYMRQKIDVVFATTEQAASFLELAPMIREHEYGRDVDVVKPIESATITPLPLVTEESANRHAKALAEKKEIKDANDRKRSDYDSAMYKVTEATKSVWSDWHDCQKKEAKMRLVIDTLAEYRSMAGDEDTARAFLAKAFDEHTIDEAFVWFGKGADGAPPTP